MDNDLEADFERLPTIAFGREFTHIPEHVRQNLDTLDRESAIYSDQWIEEIGDFRHLRIRFTDDERVEFARRFWAFELFIRAGHLNWARTTPWVEPHIVSEAETYSPLARYGAVLQSQ